MSSPHQPDDGKDHTVSLGKNTPPPPGYEAEAQLGGTADASLKVRPLCQDRLEVRLTLRT